MSNHILTNSALKKQELKATLAKVKQIKPHCRLIEGKQSRLNCIFNAVLIFFAKEKKVTSPHVKKIKRIIIINIS